MSDISIMCSKGEENSHMLCKKVVKTTAEKENHKLRYLYNICDKAYSHKTEF